MSQKYQRKTFLINPNFQLRLSFFVTTWLVPLSFLYPVIYYKLFDLFIEYAKQSSLLETVEALETIRSSVLKQLIIIQVVFMVVTFLISLFMSHKIAGPLYKLHQAFARAKNGNFDKGLRFRNSDHFQELSQDFNDMVTSVRDLLDQNVETVSTAIKRIESALPNADKKNKEEMETALAELRKVREKLTI